MPPHKGHYLFSNLGGLMKQVWTIVVVGIALMLAGCGTNSSNGSLDGNWTAALISSNSNASPNLNFTLSMAETGGSNLSITNLNFATSSPCFATDATASGGFTLS